MNNPLNNIVVSQVASSAILVFRPVSLNVVDQLNNVRNMLNARGLSFVDQGTFLSLPVQDSMEDLLALVRN